MFFLLPRYLSKNHMAREGANIVGPVIIAALAPILCISLKEDRSLYPISALSYYLDETMNLKVT